jgi:hypothetical protein
MKQKSLDKQDWEKELDNILLGIDKDDLEDKNGWWETSTQAEHGAEIKVKLKSFIQSELDRQRKEILLNYFEKEDDLADNYANLKDDNWSNFLEERSKLKIKSLKSK